MDGNPLVSIVIPVYNGSKYMREAIDSALAQTYSAIEIIVVNDGSTDDTRDIALSYGDKIRYYEKENGGVSTALNFAIKKMHGDFFSWLSHDDIYYPNKIEAEMDALVASGDMLQGVYSGWETILMPNRIKVPYNDVPLFSKLEKKYFKVGALITVLGLLSGCSLLVPKIFFDDYGLFDESLRGVQDYKKFFQIFKGKNVLYVDEILIQSRVHPEQVTYRYNKMKEEENDLYLWFMKSLKNEDFMNCGLNEYLFFGAMISGMRRNAFYLASNYALKRVLCLDEPQNAYIARREFEKYLYNFGGNKIYIFCNGLWGKALAIALYLRGIDVAGITDSNSQKNEGILNIPFIELDRIPKNELIIVAKYQPRLVEEFICKKGYQNIILYDDLINWLLKTPVKKSIVIKYDMEMV